MSGCDWQKESFSVGTSTQKVVDVCDVCSFPISGTVYNHNGDTLCRNCFLTRPTLRKRFGIEDGVFNTTKDRLYNFLDNKNFRKPVEVRGKAHWKRLLKQHGLTDDFEQKPVKPEDLKQYRGENKKLEHSFVRDEILRELQEKGLSDKLVRRRR